MKNAILIYRAKNDCCKVVNALEGLAEIPMKMQPMNQVGILTRRFKHMRTHIRYLDKPSRSFEEKREALAEARTLLSQETHRLDLIRKYATHAGGNEMIWMYLSDIQASIMSLYCALEQIKVERVKAIPKLVVPKNIAA